MDLSEVPAALRLEVEEHIRRCLEGVYRSVQKRVICAEAGAIETTAFARAKSRGEYLCIVSSYAFSHEGRGSRVNDTYRVPALSVSEEKLRKAKLREMILDSKKRRQRQTQGVVQGVLEGNVHKKAQQNVPINTNLSPQPSMEQTNTNIKATVPNKWQAILQSDSEKTKLISHAVNGT